LRRQAIQVFEKICTVISADFDVAVDQPVNSDGRQERVAGQTASKILSPLVMQRWAYRVSLTNLQLFRALVPLKAQPLSL
jgi:hypothetical protein